MLVMHKIANIKKAFSEHNEINQNIVVFCKG